MAQIDLKNATVLLYDGSDLTNSTVMDSAGANADVTVTPIAMTSPCSLLTITFTDPSANNQPLTVTVTGSDIDVSLATDGGGAITSTAAQVVAALAAHAVASTLVTAVAEGTGAGVVDAIAQTTLTANGTDNWLKVKIGEGNLTYTENRPVTFTRDRGLLDTVREADDEPMAVTLDFTWEFLSSAAGATTPTVEEALRNEGPASDWVNGSSDPCTPFAVNIAVCNDVNCGTDPDEVVEIEEFYFESLAHDLRAGTVSVAGRSNKKKARKYRPVALVAL